MTRPLTLQTGNPARRIVVAVLLSGLLAACGGGERLGEATLTPIEAPAAAGGRFPHLATIGKDTLAMIWTEVEAARSPRLLGSRYDGLQWDEPSVIAEDDELFVNWADFPSFAPLTDGSLAVHWLRREGRRSYAYGIRFSVLSAQWEQRSPPQRPHADGSEAEHGFVSLIPGPEGAVGLAWLDGRRMEGSAGTMQLLYREWSDGWLGDEVVLDSDVCTCCQTAGVRVGGEPLVFYRDHAQGEIRDISFVQRSGGSWSAPRTLYRDGWEIAGCPVNGPAADAAGHRVAVAWYTRADDSPRVLLAISDDTANGFGAPLRLDDGDPLGRVDLEMRGDGTLFVSWLEKTTDGAAIRIRPVDRSGTPLEALTVSRTRALRDSGFPRLAIAAGRLYVTWTDPTSPPTVKLARIDF